MEARALEHERRLGQTRGEAALGHAIAAAELYMQAAAKAKAPEDRARLRRKCAELIARGERLKANTPVRPPVPVSARSLTTAEKTILLKASRLHGSVFLPWESAPGAQAFSDAYIDPSPFSLSPEQQAIFAGWRRAAELVSGANHGDAERGPQELMAAKAEMDLVQDLATDCSVVASLCAAARHFGPTNASLLAPHMHPFDHQAMRPQISKNGKYVFRLYFNGAWRQVTIDDRLPASSTDRTLHVVDRANPKLIWPALVEKAYLKIRGGYDFPGSNSGTDLHALTGWIPEQIVLQSDGLELDGTWDRIKKAYDEGNVILTLGTGNMLPEEEQALGLVREHDYAVVDLKEDENSRLLLIKNPWVDSLVWTGIGSSATPKAHTVGSTSDRSSNQFWMAFEDVLQHFDSLYANWNPALFTHRQDHHFRWDMPDKTEELVYTHNPQYSVLSPSRDPVWVLLSRHWQDGELDILRQRKADKHRGDGSLASVSKQLGFTALALYASSPAGTRIPLSDGHSCLHQSPFVDSPNTLLRYDPTPGVPHTLVVTQSDLPLPSYTFTLSFFSTAPLTIGPAPEPLPHSVSLTGAWTRRTAGGSAAHPTYHTNPQYALTLADPTPVSLVLSTSARDLPVHLAVVFSSSSSSHRRVTAALSARGGALVAASPEYQRGCTAAFSRPGCPLDRGTYVVVASTFEPGHTAPFALRVCAAAAPVTLRPLPPEAAGRLRTPLPLVSVAAVSAGGCRIRAPLGVARLTRVGVLARLAAAAAAAAAVARTTTAGAAPVPAMRLALELGTGPHRAVLAVSGEGEGGGAGEFGDVARGLRTGEVDVDPEVMRARGGLWVVLEQLGGGAGGGGGGGGGGSGVGGQAVQVEVLSDGVVQVGGWENADEE